jgi:putative membrane-bound dehydrogenase-like protein
VLPWKGGVLVSAAPNLWFFKDIDGDGRADERRVLFTGFGEGNQQLRVNGLHWGLDNWVYGANGRSDGEVRRPEDPPSKAVSLRGHDFRFRPETGAFEVLAGRSQFGTTFDEAGHRYLSWNTIPIRQVVLEEFYLARNPALASTESLQDLLPAQDTKEVFPLTPPPLVFNEESSSHFNALAGLTIYRSPELGRDPSGREYSGNAFMGESLRNLVHRRILVPHGTSYLAERGEQGKEFLAATDPWFHPVNFATGPDGALYIVDFYRRFVEHPHYVHDPQMVETVPWREGEGHGRIWRVRRRSGRSSAERASLQPALGGAAPGAWVEALGSRNGWMGETAQRLLVERADVSVVPVLREAAENSRSTQQQLRALWCLEGLQCLPSQTLARAAQSTRDDVRENAIALSESRMLGDADVRAAVLNAASDSNPRVRLRAALALGALGGDAAVHGAQLEGLERVLQQPGLDRWQALAALSSVAPQAWPLFLGLVQKDSAWLAAGTPERALVVQKLAQLIGADRSERDWREARSWVLREKEAREQPGRIVFLAGLADGLSQAGVRLFNWLATGQTLGEGKGIPFEAVEQEARSAALSSALSSYLRVASVRVLGESKAALAGKPLLQLLDAAQPLEVQAAAVQALAGMRDESLAREVFRSWTGHARYSRQRIVAASPSSPVLAAALCSALEAGEISPLEIDASTRQVLLKKLEAPLRQRVGKLLGVSGDRQAVLVRFTAALELEGDSGRGAFLFAKTCLICHAIQGQGNAVGPDLSAIGTRPKEALLIDILDPSRTVSPDFVSYTVDLVHGESLTGVIASETAGSLTLRRPQQPEITLPRARIQQVRADGKSLMPDGLEQGWTPQDMADLLAFLRKPEVLPAPPAQ